MILDFVPLAGVFMVVGAAVVGLVVLFDIISGLWS